MAKDDKAALEQAAKLDARKKQLDEVQADLARQQEEIVAEKEQIEKWKTTLGDMEDGLRKREKGVAVKEKALAGVEVPSVEEVEKPLLSPDDIGLIEKAMTAYGIDPEHVLDANIDRLTGQAVVLTKGGAKVKYADGDEEAKGFEPLSPERIDGVSRKKPRKPLMGKKEKKDRG